jgi:glycosyltransferase involved in cell wall biosynthesis
MRTSTENPAGELGTAAGARSRAERAAEQEAVLPSGHVVVSCPAPYGTGGLGRHLEEIVEALDRRGQTSTHLAGRPPDSSPARRATRKALNTMLRPVMRVPSWRYWRTSVEYDAYAARRLPAGDHLIGFNGTSLAQLRRAPRMGYQSVSLMAANSHMRQVIRQHQLAYRQYPVERPWPTHLLKRNLREYELAERLYVASRYTRESFLEEGFSEDALPLFPLTPHPRYSPAPGQPRSDTFDVLYVGSFAVHKGVPLLLDAFSRTSHRDMRLVLVGGWKTRSMRRLIQQACARDPRISVTRGDPLPHLRSARLFVHPAYEDGFAYAPAEALACGVPVLVSEDTGMKDLIDPGVSGLILPTGDVGSLTDSLEAAYRGEAFGR